MEQRIRDLRDYGDRLFGARGGLHSLWQEIAENFYPERADFTGTRTPGADFAGNLVTSYPLLCRRDLGNAFSAMLRPRDREWFSIATGDDRKLDNLGRRWLEWAAMKQRKAMYDRRSLFVRATKEGDHDFAGFGQCVLSAELGRDQDHLLYRCWHLRDVAWIEGADGKLCEVHRNWRPTARDLDYFFRGKVSAEVKRALEKEPNKEFAVRHVVIDAGRYDAPPGKQWKTPYVSVYFELDGGFVNEEIGVHNPIYVVPRWQTVSGSQYAYSPATVAALPDARLIQAMTLVLLEAGEKAVNPPLIAASDVVRSDVQVFAGGITWVDAEYDERLGEVLRPMTIDGKGIPLGMEMREDIKSALTDAFYLNKIGLPPADGKEMTAYEAGQRVQEYIRNALPLFEPMELEYNGALCDITFNLMQRAGAFGGPQDLPPSLSGASIEFKFESPLHRAIEKQKGQGFVEAKALLAEAVALDPASARMVDVRTALRDALDGIGTPAAWLRGEEQMAELDEQAARQQRARELLDVMTQGGAAAEQIGKAGVALNQMQTGAA